MQHSQKSKNSVFTIIVSGIYYYFNKFISYFVVVGETEMYYNYYINFNLCHLFLFQSKKSDELSVQLQSVENEKSSLHAVISTQERQISDLNIKVLQQGTQKCDHFN